VTLFRSDNSWNYLWYSVQMTPQSNNDTMGLRLINNMALPYIWLDQKNILDIQQETSHNTSSLKGWMLYNNRYYWLTYRSHPRRSHLMLYGCGCGVVDNPNCLMTFVEMRFFWLPLSTMKCNRVPFTHICEWKRCSPSSISVGSSG
jgi:hypothetical protein